MRISIRLIRHLFIFPRNLLFDILHIRLYVAFRALLVAAGCMDSRGVTGYFNMREISNKQFLSNQI